MLTLCASLSGKSLEIISEEHGCTMKYLNMDTLHESYSTVKKGDKVNLSFSLLSFNTTISKEKIYLFENNNSGISKFSGEIIYKGLNFVVVDTHELAFFLPFKGEAGDFVTGSGELRINYLNNFDYCNSDVNNNFIIEEILELDQQEPEIDKIVKLKKLYQVCLCVIA